MAGERRYWLLKADPAVFGFAELWAAKSRTSAWDGVRNYQARNNLREMRAGDLAFLYHSNADPPAIAGIVEILREACPDPTQFDRRHEHFDPRSKREQPTWLMVDVRAVEPLPRPVALEELRREPALAAMAVCQRASRLSVQPVLASEWGVVLALSRRKSTS